MAFGAKSTEFMAPPDFAFTLMREAALRLALDDPTVRPLLNPRQSSAIRYVGSPLNQPDTCDKWSGDDAAPGCPAPEALLADGSHLSRHFGAGFVCLVFAGSLPPDLQALEALGVDILLLPPSPGAPQAWQRYGLQSNTEEALVLVRPDAYVMGRWRGLNAAAVAQALDASGVSA